LNAVLDKLASNLLPQEDKDEEREDREEREDKEEDKDEDRSIGKYYDSNLLLTHLALDLNQKYRLCIA